MQEAGLSEDVLIIVLKEIEQEIRHDGICPKEKAQLFHQLGAIHGLMGDYPQQKFAWEEAKRLDPNNQMIKSSLKSLE
jgi:hypothetical protein